jgi:hypothetical protein
LHPSFALSNRQVRILCTIVASSAGDVFFRHVKITQCSTVGWEFIGYHFTRRIALLLQQFAHQLELSVANWYSRGNREFEKATAMFFPSEIAL